MRPVQNLSLRKSLVLYIVLFVMFALALSIMTASVCETVANKINEKYPNTGEKYYLTNEQGERLGEGTYIYKELPVLNEQDEQLLAILDLLPTVTPPIYSAFCIIAAALLFYKNKLKKPLAELRAASEKIANNDLDFSIDYDSNDELGQLCASFEIMRTTLADNFSKMWRQVEERKALNAAFAHDLRTPLTVLKGYNEMLQASDNSQTRETAATMGKHISRMENYVSSMSNLRRMEDTQPDYKLIDLQPLVSSLYDSAKIVCTKNGKELILQNNIPILQLSLDSAFISQVCNNLICGNHGCVERVVGENALTERAEACGIDLTRFAGRKPLYCDIGAMAEDGDAHAKELIKDLAVDLSFAISNLITLFNPSLVVIGGMGVNLGPFFLSNIRDEVQNSGFKEFVSNTWIQYSTLGLDSELGGAARYYIDHYYDFFEQMQGGLYAD